MIAARVQDLVELEQKHIDEQHADCGEPLDDRSGTGRRRPWREKKMANEILSMAYQDIDVRKAARLHDCATFLEFLRHRGTQEIKLEHAGFCHVRLCPICSWRRSLKAQAQMMSVAGYLARSETRYAYLLLTLTVRNCYGDELSGTIDQMMASWNRMVLRKAFKNGIDGWYRALEVTHNLTDDTYHPHFHVLLVVRESYFKKRYISQDRWVKLWQESARLDYEPSVDVRRVKGTSAAAIAEVAKYAVKDGDYIIPEDWDLTVETVRLLDSALARRRLLAFGGCVADARRKLALDDAEDGDLVHVEADKLADNLDEYEHVCFWWYSGYRQYYGRILE